MPTCSKWIPPFTDNAAPCDDGDICTVTDVCAGGICTGSGAPVCDDGDQEPGDGCDELCHTEAGGCVVLGVDVRTLEQGPEDWQLGSCSSQYCENTPTVIPAGWHIATIEEVAHLVQFVEFGSCGAYGICGSYWYGGSVLTGDCTMLHYTCTAGGCTAYTDHCYTQVMLIRDGKDGTCSI